MPDRTEKADLELLKSIMAEVCLLEREECAKLVEDWSPCELMETMPDALGDIVRQIRSRGDK